MSKTRKSKYYAVRNGRQGAKVYTSWEETKQNVSRWPGAIHKSFNSLSQAQDWLGVASNLQNTYLEGPPSGWTPPLGPISGPFRQQGRNAVAPRSSDTSSSGSSSHESIPEEEFRPRPQDNIALSSEQRTVLQMVKDGDNVFFTGSAGTGKSVLLREIIRHCRGHSDNGLAVTAATGIASVNIGGSTLHSWAGIGLGLEPAEKLAMKILGKDKHQRKETAQGYEDTPAKNSRVVERWRECQTLIVDEISMIDGILFDKLEHIARVIRNRDEPFGGIQLVLSGDFCQLPPVPNRVNGVQQPATFAFDSKSWSSCIDRTVVLKKVFRQKEQAFVDMLNAMRFGRLSPDTILAFKRLARTVSYDDGIEPTDLFPTRREVDTANVSRLNRLPHPAHTYQAVDIPGFDEAGMPLPFTKIEPLLERLVAPKAITLKAGAQVMLIKNLVQGQLVNGSVGRVIDFSTPQDAIQRGAEIARSVNVKGDGGNKIPEEILRSNNIWPIVQFGNGLTLLCVPDTFEVNNADGRVEASRRQIPLILAWALSIHKSQGQTLERVRVNLGNVFEKGQAYVALSRATCMETLEVHNFDAAKVVAHPRVLEWMSHLTGEDYRTQEEIDDDEEYWDEFL